MCSTSSRVISSIVRRVSSCGRFAAALALTEEGHEVQTYNLVGPELLSGPVAAAIWSKLLDNEVRYGGENLNQ
jgi:uncharacterized protein YbjT (DUF2867 family)